MTVKFRCEKCHKTVEAPDSAAGKRGKCPYCGAMSYIPSPDVEEIPLAPIDESDEEPIGQRCQPALHNRLLIWSI